MENYALPLLNINNLILELDDAFFILLTLSVAA
jgi:hypothetical protein